MKFSDFKEMFQYIYPFANEEVCNQKQSKEMKKAQKKKTQEEKTRMLHIV